MLAGLVAPKVVLGGAAEELPGPGPVAELPGVAAPAPVLAASGTETLHELEPCLAPPAGDAGHKEEGKGGGAKVFKRAAGSFCGEERKQQTSFPAAEVLAVVASREDGAQTAWHCGSKPGTAERRIEEQSRDENRRAEQSRAAQRIEEKSSAEKRKEEKRVREENRRAEQHRAEQRRAEQSSTEQSRYKKRREKKTREEQSRAGQGSAEQHTEEQSIAEH